LFLRSASEERLKSGRFAFQSQASEAESKSGRAAKHIATPFLAVILSAAKDLSSIATLPGIPHRREILRRKKSGPQDDAKCGFMCGEG
jgi:hypothetical protein